MCPFGELETVSAVPRPCCASQLGPQGCALSRTGTEASGRPAGRPHVSVTGLRASTVRLTVFLALLSGAEKEVLGGKGGRESEALSETQTHVLVILVRCMSWPSNEPRCVYGLLRQSLAFMYLETVQ